MRQRLSSFLKNYFSDATEKISANSTMQGGTKCRVVKVLGCHKSLGEEIK